MNKGDFPIKVELHGFLGKATKDAYVSGNIKGVTDVTRYLKSVKWTHSTREPWEGIDLEMSLPWYDLQRVMPGVKVGTKTTSDGTKEDRRNPAPGFWCVVRSPGPGQIEKTEKAWPAVAWGRCSIIEANWSIRASHKQGGGAPGEIDCTVKIQCESWLMTLARSKLVITPSNNTSLGEGFYYTLQSWSKYISALLRGGASGKSPGKLFETLWKKLAMVRLPDTLTGELLPFATQIPLVWNRQKCADHAPMRLVNHNQVPGSPINAFGSILPRATLWRWLEGTFMPDGRVAEIFPSLEFPSDLELTDEAAFFGGEDLTPLETPLTATPEKLTEIGKALGAQPVLVYRVKPLQVAPVSIRAVNNIYNDKVEVPAGEALGDVKREKHPVPIAQKAATASGRYSAFGQDPSSTQAAADTPWQTIELDQIRSFQIRWKDADRVNATHTKLPFQSESQLQLHGLFGFPVVDAGDTWKHGLRLQDIEWPYLLTPGLGVGTVATALSDVFHSITGCNDEGYFYGHATFKIDYSPWSKAGFWYRGAFPEMDRSSTEEEEQDAGWSGYANQITHEVMFMQNGAVQAQTTLVLERVSMLGKGVAAYTVPLRTKVNTTGKIQ